MPENDNVNMENQDQQILAQSDMPPEQQPIASENQNQEPVVVDDAQK